MTARLDDTMGSATDEGGSEMRLNNLLDGAEGGSASSRSYARAIPN